MPYSVLVALAAAAVGLVYSLGIRAERLRDVLGEHVPMEPAPVGVLVLFTIGATLGLYLACLLLSSQYLATQQGRKLMRGLSGTQGVAAFRAVCAGAVLFLAGSTAFVLWYTYLFLRD
jgi:hypothetical protein